MKKKNKWVHVVMGMLALSLLSACTEKNNSSELNKSSDSSLEETADIHSSNSSETTQSSKRRLKVTVNKDDISSKQELSTLDVLNKAYKDFGVVNFDSKTKTYSIAPFEFAVADGAMYAKEDADMYKEYMELVENVQGVSNSITKRNGSGYTLEMMNPKDLDNNLIVVKDGEVIYDIVRDSANS